MWDPSHERWLAIVNPNAAAGAALENMVEAEAVFKAHNFRIARDETNRTPPETSSEFGKTLIVVRQTTAPGDAIRIAREALDEGWRRFIAVGGDGTVHEVANGLCIQSVVSTDDITLAQLPIGTGNDWRRTLDLPQNSVSLIRAINQGRTRKHDLGIARFVRDGRPAERCFINTAGLGLDAEVTAMANASKDEGRGGKLAYVDCLARSLYQCRPIQCRVSYDGDFVEEKMLSVSIGVGKYSGGGLRLTPLAEPDDGLFDVTIIPDMHKSRVLANLHRLFLGTLCEHPSIPNRRAVEVGVETWPATRLQLDGESVGSGPVTFTIKPRALNILAAAQ